MFLLNAEHPALGMEWAGGAGKMGFMLTEKNEMPKVSIVSFLKQRWLKTCGTGSFAPIRIQRCDWWVLT